MTLNPLVAAFFAKRPARGSHTIGGQVPEWQDCVCSIGHTRAGKMYCAMCCDGSHCQEDATPERLAHFAAYNAKRLAHNRKATAEANRIARKVENIPGAENEGRTNIA